MRSQGDKCERKLNLLEYNFHGRDNELDYILAVRKYVKNRMGSIDVSVLYNDLYDEHFNLKSNTPEDSLIGPVLYREQESIDDFISYQVLLTLYIERDIRKFFGLTVNEFLNLNRYERIEIVKVAEKQMEVMDRRLKELKEDAGTTSDAYTDLEDSFGG